MSFIENIKSFFRRLVKKDNKLIEESNLNNQDKLSQNHINNFDNKKKFIDSININSEELYLQKKLEQNEISIDDLSIFEVMDLVDLYKKQLNVA